MPTFATVAEVVSDAAVELGLGAVSDVFASTDSNVVQLRGLLKSTGRKLCKVRTWRQLRKTHTLTTTADTTSYPLPDDFVSMVDQSGWNRTQQQPMVPISSEAWQYLKATLTGHTLTALFRLETSTLEFEQAPAAGDTVAFEYVSNHWVALDGSTTGTKSKPTLNTDVLLFDASLMLEALKLAFLKAKGFDSTAVQREYDALLPLEASANVGAAPALRIGGGRHGEHLIDGCNAPETGYGS